jgi:hypothetical protein
MQTQTGNLQPDLQLTGRTLTTKVSLDHEMMLKYDISWNDMMIVYLSPHPFDDSFKQQLRQRSEILDIQPSTLTAKIRAQQSQLGGHGLLKWTERKSPTSWCTWQRINHLCAPS